MLVVVAAANHPGDDALSCAAISEGSVPFGSSFLFRFIRHVSLSGILSDNYGIM
jgi:hypothetical protein